MAILGVTSRIWAEENPRNGPPLAVSTIRRRSLRLPGLQGLKNRTVLTIDRNQRTTGRALGQRGHQRSGNNQRLFVGKGDSFAGLQGGPRAA